jgi:2-(1,2-epoxy-1,2-dihydrophenyl)acetyl-CoA isomerase
MVPRMSTTDHDGLVQRLEGAVLWIVLNRPDQGNAIVRSQYSALAELMEHASAAPDIRSVVITGAGRHFCTGVDVNMIKASTDAVHEPMVGDFARIARSGAQRMVSAVFDCEVPVIAAVNGTAAGLGMHLALACDLVVAAESARFIEVFVRRGLVPDGGGTWLLPRLIGLQRAKELMFLGDDVSASRALQLGLVNSVVADQLLEETACSLATRLADGPSAMLTLTKRLLNRSFESDRNTALEDEAVAIELARSSPDAQEGVAAFLERRPTRFGVRS